MTQTTAKAPEGILERIRKCLTLGDKTKGATEAEAETAIKMAKTLMAKHNLSMSDVEVDEQTQGGVKEAFDESGRANKEVWEIALSLPINKLFDVDSYSQKKFDELKGIWRHRLAFFGLGDDAAIAAESYTTLAKVIRRMATESGKIYGSEWHGEKREYNGRERNSYCMGIVDTLHHRACEQVEGLNKKQQETIRTMVLVKSEAIQDYKEDLGLSKGRQRNFGVDHQARARGRVDGKGVSMSFRNQLRGEG